MAQPTKEQLQEERNSMRAAARMVYDNIDALKAAYKRGDVTKEQYEMWMGRYQSQLEDILDDVKKEVLNDRK